MLFIRLNRLFSTPGRLKIFIRNKCWILHFPGDWQTKTQTKTQFHMYTLSLEGYLRQGERKGILDLGESSCLKGQTKGRTPVLSRVKGSQTLVGRCPRGIWLNLVLNVASSFCELPWWQRREETLQKLSRSKYWVVSSSLSSPGAFKGAVVGAQLSWSHSILGITGLYPGLQPFLQSPNCNGILPYEILSSHGTVNAGQKLRTQGWVHRKWIISN